MAHEVFGIALGGNPLKKDFWLPVIERLAKRVDG